MATTACPWHVEFAYAIHTQTTVMSRNLPVREWPTLRSVPRREFVRFYYFSSRFHPSIASPPHDNNELEVLRTPLASYMLWPLPLGIPGEPSRIIIYRDKRTEMSVYAQRETGKERDERKAISEIKRIHRRCR